MDNDIQSPLRNLSTNALCHLLDTISSLNRMFLGKSIAINKMKLLIVITT